MDSTYIHGFLLLVLLPSWLCVGLFDWWCHKTSRIEETVGPKESVLHLVLSAQAAAAVLPALMLEINAAIIAWAILMFIAHELTTNLDVHLAVAERPFTTAEMRAHNFLTAVPFAALLLVMATHADQAAALVGLGAATADFSLRWKEEPLPLAYLIAWIAGATLMNVVPFTEEFFRCLRKAIKQG